MPTLTPVDGDPFADDPSPAPAPPSSAPSVSFAPGSGGGGPAPSAPPAPAPRDPVLIPVDHDPFADDGGDARPLTVRGGRRADAPIGGSAAILPAGLSDPSPAAPPQAAPAPAAAPQPRGMSYDEAATPPTPHPGGVLSNSADDGYMSGALKGAATGAIKGVGDAVGAYGGLSSLADYLIARGESAVTGKPVDQVMAEHAATRQRVQADMAQDPLGRLVNATDPANVMPTPEGVTAPILSRAGEFVPTSEPGKIAQAAVEGAVGGIGPGMGAISPGTAGRAAVGALARQAPAVAVASGVGQATTDFTGDPLLGLGAGLAGVPLAEAAGSKLASAAAPIAGGSFLNDMPVAGPMIRRGRENQVAGMILGAADDPAAVRSAANAPAPAPAVPGSPQTFAGQVGDDQGLFEAEKALRNTKAEKLTDGSAPTYFNAVDRGQSAAQTAALQGLQPTGDVFAPGQLLSQRMDAVDAAAEDAVDRLQAAHDAAVAGRAGATQSFADAQSADLAARQADRAQAGLDFAGQQRSDLADRNIARGQASGDDKAQADAFRQAQQDRLAGQFAEVEARQRGIAEDAAAPLVGGQVPADALGGALRSSIEAVRSGQKDIHRQLYRAVDPDGTLNLVASPISDGATRIVGDVRADGSAMTASEAPLFARAAALPDVAPYRVVHALDRDVGAAMSGEMRANGESPAWSRLQRLKGVVKGAMTNAADAQSAWEASQVDAGAMAPEDTIAGRLGGFFGAGADEWDAAGQELQARQRTGTGDPAYPASGAVSVPGSYGAEGQGLGGPRSAPRDPGLSGPRGGGAAPQAQGLNPADLEARVFRQSVPAEPEHRVVPVDADKVDVLTGWQPDYRIAPGQGGPGGKLARASDFISGLQDGQDFRPPVLGVHDGGMGFDDGRHRFAAMRDLGFKTVPVSMDAASEAAARRLGLVTEPPAREVGAEPRPDAPPYDPDGLRAPQRPDMPRPQDLRAFVKERGGIRDTGGDLAAMGMHDLIGKGGNGLSADRMRRLAAEAGYLGADTDRAMRETHPNDLLDALSGDRPVHSVRDEDAAAQWDAYDEARGRYRDARDTFSRSRFGVRREPAPLTAYSRDDIDGPGVAQILEPPRSGLVPNFDKTADGRLREANAAYAQYARTYRQGPVAPGLRTTGYAGQYRTGDASFLKAGIQPGAGGYERARAYLQAARNDPDAVAALHDAALNPLRRAALGNGTLTPKALANWRDGYGPALRALDEVTPGFSGHFDDAGRATQALIDLGAEHKQALQAHQADAARAAVLDNLQRRQALGQANAEDKAAVNRLLADRKASDRAEGQADRAGVAGAIADRRSDDRAADAQSRADLGAGKAAVRAIRAEAKASPAGQFAAAAGGKIAPTEVENVVGGMLKTGTGGATRMRGLVGSVADDPDALAGLRRAAVEWIAREHTGADGLLQGGKLIQFLTKNRDTLNELFPHDQRTTFGALARDAEANARWRTATAIKGGSDSVKNLLMALDKVPHGGAHASLMWAAIEATSLGFEHAGFKGAALGGTGAAFAYLGNTLREAGIRRTADLYREAMANPDLARAFIQKMPAKADGGALHNLARVLRRGLIVGPMLAGQDKPVPPSPTGGGAPSPSGGSAPPGGGLLASLASGHAHDDLDAYARAHMPSSTAGKAAAAAAYAPASVLARGADALTNAGRYADDALHGRLGTDLRDPATVDRMVPGAVQTAGLMLPPGMASAERGALGVAGGAATTAGDRYTLDPSTLGDINELLGLGRNWKAPDPYAANNAAIRAHRDAGSPEIPRGAPPPPMSRTVDPSAGEARLYHGTAATQDFSRFDPSIAGPNVSRHQGSAVFMTPDPQEAGAYARMGQRDYPLMQGEAGARVIPADVDLGRSHVYDLPAMFDAGDPRLMAGMREMAEASGRGRFFDDMVARERASRAAAAAAGKPDPGLPIVFNAHNAAIAMAREDGLDTAVLRGLKESAGADQVAVLTPNRVRGALSGDVLYSRGAPVPAGRGDRRREAPPPPPMSLFDGVLAAGRGA